MGKGKGMIDKWVYPSKRGMVLFEIKCNDALLSYVKNVLKKSSNSLSIKTKVIDNFYNL